MIMPVLLAAAAVQSCQSVDGDRIFMRDLASADARFVLAAADKPVGYSPEPGATRVFWPMELANLARQSGVATESPFTQICFQRRTHVLSNGEVTAAIREWVPSTASVEVIDNSRFAVPSGKLVIPRPSAAQSVKDGALLLHGYVEFSPTQHYPVWACARIKLVRKVLVATEEIAIGAVIGPELMKLEDRECGIEALQFTSEPDQVSGRAATRKIPAGSPIPVASLEPPKQVIRGAIVKVEVRDGAALLVLDGEAQASGRTGDVIRVRNPSSGKSFQARIVGLNAVQVIPRGLSLMGTEQK